MMSRRENLGGSFAKGCLIAIPISAALWYLLVKLAYWVLG